MGYHTGIENEYVIKDNKRLRLGYTTGSCAAAAAQAAAKMLLGQERCERATLTTPKGITLDLDIEDICIEAEQVSCAVRKDGGDDPDVTNGLLIYARVSKSNTQGINIDGGIGVGRVTKRGLQQPVGAAAINHVPRQMITNEIEKICQQYGFDDGIDVEIYIPAGAKTAKRTFNPRLGIVDGLSVLGTSGIVVPMSEAALIESIRIEMKLMVENGARYLIITPGNYGEIFMKEQSDIDLTNSMKCSNYIKETLEMALELGVKGILFAAHIGKFIKVSGGIMNTHSHHADARAELMAAQAIRAGATLAVAKHLLSTVTTEEAIDILIASGDLKATMQETIKRVQFYLEQQVNEELAIGTIIFSSVHGKLGQSDNVPELIKKINSNTYMNNNT